MDDDVAARGAVQRPPESRPVDVALGYVDDQLEIALRRSLRRALVAADAAEQVERLGVLLQDESDEALDAVLGRALGQALQQGGPGALALPGIADRDRDLGRFRIVAADVAGDADRVAGSSKAITASWSRWSTSVR